MILFPINGHFILKIGTNLTMSKLLYYALRSLLHDKSLNRFEKPVKQFIK